jgi:glycogen operon protein
MTKAPQLNLNDYISKISEHADVRAGTPMPVGAHASNNGENFALFSRNSTRVRLEFFNHPEDAAPARAIDFDSARNLTGDVWHV